MLNLVNGFYDAMPMMSGAAYNWQQNGLVLSYPYQG